MRAVVFSFTLIFIFFIPWEGVIQFQALGGAVKLAGFALAAFWLLEIVINKRFRKPALFHFLVSCFVVWNMLSLFWSADINSSLGHILTWLQILGMVIIFWDLFTSQEMILAGLQAYILGSYVAIGNTLSNYFSGNTFYYERFSAVGTNPDDLGAVLALGIPLAWYLASSYKSGKMSNILKFINYAYIPASLFGMALSGTRTAIVASIPGMIYGFMSLLQFKMRTRIIILTLLFITMFTMLPFVQTLPSYQRLGTTGSELEAGSFNGRINLWREGLNVFTKNPLIGIGGNMYRTVTSEMKVAHNSFISVLVELGLIGFLLFGSILLIVFREILKLPKPHLLFWLIQFITWGICASTLTFEHRKPTWLFFSLIISSSAIWAKTTEQKVNKIESVMYEE